MVARCQVAAPTPRSGAAQQQTPDRPAIAGTDIVSASPVQTAPPDPVHLVPLTHADKVRLAAQPGDPAPKGHSYIAASYVKFVEVRRMPS